MLPPSDLDDDDAPVPLNVDPDYDLSAGLDPVPEDAPEEERVKQAAAQISSAALARLADVKGHAALQTPADYEWVSERMRDNATFISNAKDRFAPVINKAQDALNAVRDLLHEAIAPAVEELDLYRALRHDYEKRQRESRLAGNKGFPKAGEPPTLSIVPPPIPKTEGVYNRKKVSLTVDDERTAIAACVERKMLVLLGLDTAAVKKYASMYPDWTLPGVTITHEETAVVRTRKP